MIGVLSLPLRLADTESAGYASRPLDSLLWARLQKENIG